MHIQKFNYQIFVIVHNVFLKFCSEEFHVRTLKASLIFIFVLFCFTSVRSIKPPNSSCLFRTVYKADGITGLTIIRFIPLECSFFIGIYSHVRSKRQLVDLRFEYLHCVVCVIVMLFQNNVSFT